MRQIHGSFVHITLHLKPQVCYHLTKPGKLSLKEVSVAAQQASLPPASTSIQYGHQFVSQLLHF